MAGMRLLSFLQQQTPAILFLLFFLENLVVVIISVWLGALLTKIYKAKLQPVSAKEYRQCAVTTIINTGITYAGFYLWQVGIISFTLIWQWRVVVDFVLLFIGMDLLMFIFHYGIHHTRLYRLIHGLHHHYVHPSPIDLYVLHPLETIGFGSLWLMLLHVYSFNLYAVMVYLTINVLFGIVGHLGFDPLPDRLKNSFPLRYLGTSSFHHNHHQHIGYNFGFYTVLWDKLFGTYKAE